MAFNYQQLASEVDEQKETVASASKAVDQHAAARVKKIRILATSAGLLLLILWLISRSQSLSSLEFMTSSDGLSSFPSLEERLHDLEAKPILSYDDMVTLSLQGCPEGIYRREAQAHFSEWRSMSSDSIKKVRQGMVEHLRSLGEDEVVYKLGQGKAKTRGIVMAGGNAHTLERLEASIRYLRESIHTDLPIQLFHFADELQDAAGRQKLERYKVELKQIEEKHGGKRRQYSIKPKAFLQTTYDEFAYFDADSIPLLPLDEYFDSFEYRTFGSVFYPDLSKDNPQNSIWRVLGLACSNEWWTAESGQLFFDKTANGGLNLAVLQLSVYITEHPELFGTMGWGDKDAYRYSFFALGLPYSQAPRAYSVLGSYRNSSGYDTDYFNGHSMLQWGLTPWKERHNPEYRQLPGMIHSNQLKHFKNLNPDCVFDTVQQPLQDGIRDPRMARILYTHHWPALFLDLSLIGPDGRKNVSSSYGDGQAIVQREFQEVMAHDPRLYGDLVNFGRLLASFQAEEVN